MVRIANYNQKLSFTEHCASHDLLHAVIPTPMQCIHIAIPCLYACM